MNTSLTINPQVYEIRTCTNPYTLMNYTNMPSWLQQNIEDVLITNNDFINIKSITDSLNNTLNTLETGIHHYIDTYSSDVVTYLQEVDAIKASFNDNVAGIISANTTLATKEYAETIAADLLTTTFGTDVEAWANSIITTRVNGVYSTVQDYNILSATLEDNTIELTRLQALSLGIPYKITLGDWNDELIGDFEYTIGMYKEAATSIGAPDSSGVYWQYVGGVLGENGSGWAYLPKGPSSTEDWLAVSSNFIRDNEGNITGWGFADGSEIGNEFNITADKFKLYASSNFYPDWVYPLFEVTFPGIGVRPSYITRSKAFFYSSGTSTDTVDRTEIDGNKIVTGSISVNEINSDNIWDIKTENGTLNLINTSGTYESVFTDYIDISRGGNFKSNEYDISFYGTLGIDKDKFSIRNITVFFYDITHNLINPGSASGGTQMFPQQSTDNGIPNYIKLEGHSFTRLAQTAYYIKVKIDLTLEDDISAYTNYSYIRWQSIIKARQNYITEW